jgi:hypothetical protein
VRREKQERRKGKSLQPSLSIIFSWPYLLAFIGTVFLLSIGGQFSNPAFSYFESLQKALQPNVFIVDQHIRHPTTFSTQPRQVSITDLLTNSQDYHQQLVTVQGLITQPELHLDETELYLDFVFRLAQDKDSIVVYGRHDRTRGPPSIIINHTVEVIGIFWKEQDRSGSRIFNALEAISVTPYPSPIPENT